VPPQPVKKFNLEHGRRLAENVPWGITRIGADQVPPGPGASGITVVSDEKHVLSLLSKCMAA